MDKYYVVNLLRDILADKNVELEKETWKINYLRNEISISTSRQDYGNLKTELDSCEQNRRLLRGQVSALRQAIAKLEKEE
jgi:predicted  nucleic acid-binding Zn-ribbon protein